MLSKLRTLLYTHRRYLWIALAGLLFVGALLTGTLVSNQVQQSKTNKWEYIQNRGRLRVIAQADLTGYLSGRSDSVQGLQAEMIEAFANEHQLQVDYQAHYNLSDALRELNRDRADLVIWDIPVYADNNLPALLTQAVFVDRLMLVQYKKTARKKDRQVNNQLDLGGKSIYLPTGSPHYKRLSHLLQEIGDTIIIKQLDNCTNAILLKTANDGKIALLACSQQAFNILGKNYPKLDATTPLGFNQPYAWALQPQDSLLCDTINAWLTRYQQSKAYKALYKRYTGQWPQIPQNYTPTNNPQQ